MNNTYSFMDVNAAIVGPGGAFQLGNGAAVAEEGITVSAAGDIGQMTIGADGAGMHSLHADKSGTGTIRLLKNSPTNALLSALYNFQTASSAAYGQNTLTVVNKQTGDSVTLSQVGFKKRPDLEYAKEGKFIEWEFNAIRIEFLLGNG